jgi:hypothetical protein
VVNGGVDAVLLGTGGGDDGAQRRMADSEGFRSIVNKKKISYATNKKAKI